MLIAQARTERLVLVSADVRFSDYDIELLPLG
jgi:PIN domain nuclease of toxin-antitoxin system